MCLLVLAIGIERPESLELLQDSQNRYRRSWTIDSKLQPTGITDVRTDSYAAIGNSGWGL